MLMFVGLISYAQQYQWTGASGDIDFFNELNWKDTSTSETPSNNSINPGENIKVITIDGNLVIGMYYEISILKKEIIVSGKKKNKIYYEEIKEISRGIGNKSVEY